MNREEVSITKPKASPAKLIWMVLAAVIVFFLIFEFVTDPTLLAQDLARNASSTHSPEVEQIVSNLRLTDKAKFIFGAVEPSLDGANVFNSACTNPEDSVSSLGCYDPVNQKIHIYYVEEEELNGEMEATAAHELLHAAWERLSHFDRDRISAQLLEVYNSSEYSEMLHKSTESYSENNLLTELHSQIAERIKDLPPELEKHYAAYFEDQDLVVNYYEQYSSVFDKIMAEAEALASEIENARVALDKMYEDYANWVADFNARVESFNTCARDADCSLVNFESRRDGLVEESRKIDAAYEAYEAARVALNAKINTYNSSVKHLKELDYALDSRAAPETKVETKEN